jgi:hypothetical protein
VRWAANGDFDTLLNEIYFINSKMQELMQVASVIEEYKDYAAKQKILKEKFQEIKDSAR